MTVDTQAIWAMAEEPPRRLAPRERITLYELARDREITLAWEAMQIRFGAGWRDVFADGGLYPEYLAGDDAGAGYGAPSIDATVDPAGPVARRDALAPAPAPEDERTMEELAAGLRTHVWMQAGRAFEAAAHPYTTYSASPEDARWTELARQARAYLETVSTPSPLIGNLLYHDAGSADMPTHAAGIVAKAEAFEAASGWIVNHRRGLLAAIDAAEAADDRAALLALDVTAGWHPQA